jgi:putative heme-binding domain-containing protein
MKSFIRIQRAAWSLTALLQPVALALIFTATVQAADKPPVTSAERVDNRIGLIGGRMVADMATYGYFETALTALWTDQDITFRNLGWPADDVFGTARSEFGSGLNTKSWKPPANAEQGFGYETLLGQVNDAKPTTLLVAYGRETAFYKSPEEFEAFKRGYITLLEDLGNVATTLILVSPPLLEDAGRPLPDPGENNKRIQKTAAFIKGLAKKGGHRLINLTDHLIPAGAKKSLTFNGQQFNQHGHQKLSQVMLEQMGTAADGGYKAEFAADGTVGASQSAKVGKLLKTKNGFRFDLTPETLPLPGAGVILIEGSTASYALKIDGEVAFSWDNGKNPKGVVVVDGRADSQYERLRQLIIQKNRFYSTRLRPLNKTYTHLFRRHEMGHLASEMDDLKRLAEEKEELIARLRQPATHRYVIDEILPWKEVVDPGHYVPDHIPEPDVAAELKAFTVADGFEINLFAADPMINKPVNMNWDTRGRLWVTGSTTYPHNKPGSAPNDRIIILEDTDHDGRADRSTLFAEGLLLPYSVMPVADGAYVCSATKLIHLIDKDGDDHAESRRVVYSGFGKADSSHLIHGLRWAPWGELYFSQAIYINSFVETPWGSRRLNGGGVWRYRPETEKLDIYTRGMTNPWGFAFDHWGQSFSTDGAGWQGPHYCFPGVAYAMATNVKETLGGMIMTGKPKNTAAEFVSGSHAPDHWQGSLLANDFRANRTVRYEIEEKDSGYTAREAETVLHSSHNAFRPVDIKIGPDGAIYVLDFYDAILGHGEVDFYHPARNKGQGRIWRISAKDRPLVKAPLIFGAPVAKLLNHLKAAEQYTRHQAKRELAARGGDAVLPELTRWIDALDAAGPKFEHHLLEALWLRGSLMAPDPGLLTRVCTASSHQTRAAGTRMISHWFDDLPGAIDMLAKAVVDQHPRVRLEAVNALREVGTLEAFIVAMRAVDHPTDTFLAYALRLTARELQKRWLPALQAGQDVFEGRAHRMTLAFSIATDQRALAPLVALIREGKVANQANACRIVATLGGQDEMTMVFSLVAKNSDVELLQVLADVSRSNKAVPKDTAALATMLQHGDEKVRVLATELAGRWKSTAHQQVLVERAGSAKTSATERIVAGRALLGMGQLEALQQIAEGGSEVAVRVTATAAWSEVDPDAAVKTAVSLLSKLTKVSDAEAIFISYYSRKDGPATLVKALSEAKLEADIAAAGIRIAQATGLDLTATITALTRAGSLQAVNVDLTKEERAALLSDAEKLGNFKRGAALYNRPALACVSCHAIKGKGGQLGPELGGLATHMVTEGILESLLKPSRQIKQGYESVVITLKNKEVRVGTLHRKTPSEVLLRDAAGKITSVPGNQIATIDSSGVSIMPPGLTNSLRRDELLDLLHYLTHLK